MIENIFVIQWDEITYWGNKISLVCMYVYMYICLPCACMKFCLCHCMWIVFLFVFVFVVCVFVQFVCVCVCVCLGMRSCDAPDSEHYDLILLHSVPNCIQPLPIPPLPLNHIDDYIELFNHFRIKLLQSNNLIIIQRGEKAAEQWEILKEYEELRKETMCSMCKEFREKESAIGTLSANLQESNPIEYKAKKKAKDAIRKELNKHVHDPNFDHSMTKQLTTYILSRKPYRYSLEWNRQFLSKEELNSKTKEHLFYCYHFLKRNM